MGKMIIGTKECPYDELLIWFESSGALYKEYPCYFQLASNMELDKDTTDFMHRALYHGKRTHAEVYQMMMEKWKEKFGDEATLGRLMAILKESGYAKTAKKLQKMFNFPVDSAEFDKLQEVDLNEYKHAKFVGNLLEHFQELIQFTTINEQLEQDLLESNIIDHALYEEMKSTSQRKPKSVKFYNHIITHRYSGEQILGLICTLRKEKQHNAVRILGEQLKLSKVA